MAITAGDGSDMRHPQVLNPGDLDLSGLRAHCRAMHSHRGARFPRSNLDLAGWHFNEHWRYHVGHIHRGLWVLVRSRRTGLTVGQIPRPLGWHTGQEPVTRAELDRQFRERMAR